MVEMIRVGLTPSGELVTLSYVDNNSVIANSASNVTKEKAQELALSYLKGLGYSVDKIEVLEIKKYIQDEKLLWGVNVKLTRNETMLPAYYNWIEFDAITGDFYRMN